MGDQCETFSLEPVYLNTLEMAFLELVLVCSPTVESLVDVIVSAQQEEPPEHVSLVLYSSPPPEEPPQQVLPHPQAEAPLEDLLAPP